MDEIERVAGSLLGEKIMGKRKPKSVEEFRHMVPLTTYDDYEPYLSERREDSLATKPSLWNHSAGRGGRFKWLPHSSELLGKAVKNFLAFLILASTRERGRVNISPGIHLLFIWPPPPYASGSLLEAVTQYFSCKVIPPPETARTMEFQDRIQKGFQIALKERIDIIGAISSVMVKMGEAFSGQSQRSKFSLSMLHPRIVFRLLRAILRSKMEKRTILPRDLWPAKAILASGTDTAIYKDDIAYYWGDEPSEVYACAESFLLAIQAWNRKGMVFLPDMVFLEFIPCEEQIKHEDDKGYEPSTVLINELEEGKSYEVVITHFYGMPLLRYRMNDIIKVIAMRDDEAQINLPHIVFQRKVGETIDLVGLARLDEKTIWQAIANTGIKYTDWSACKEYVQNQAALRIYLELKEEMEAAKVETMIDERLKAIDPDYKDIDSYLDLQPVRVTLLSPGTFGRYMDEKRKEGADLAHLKPTHINASTEIIQRLLQLSEHGRE